MTSTRLLPCAALSALVALAGCNGIPSLGPTPKPAPDADTFSILLSVMTDPANHVHHANHYKKVLSEGLHWKDLFVINKAGQSDLYWGRYASIAGAQKNLKRAKAHRTQIGTQPFAMATVVALPGEDIGPSEWNLRNADGTYTLLVAVFRNLPERKYMGRRRRAVDYCRALRDKGYDGYFYHDTYISHVTIGLFGDKAVEYYLDQGVQRTVVRERRVARLQKDFPALLVNGNVEKTRIGRDAVTHDFAGVVKSTPLIVIPGRERPDPARTGQLRTFPFPAP